MELYKIVYSDGDGVKQAGNTRFAPLGAEYAEAVSATVTAEAAEWRLCVSNGWARSNDLYDTSSSGSGLSHKGLDHRSIKGFLVQNGHFAGVVLALEFSHGGGMSSYRDSYYCILHADGRISGRNESGSTFTGEDSDSEDIDTYTLENIYGNKPVEEKKHKEGIFSFEINGEREGTCTLVGLECEEIGALEIPERLGGYTVSAIAPALCKGREDVTSLEIPNTVEEIGTEAFAGCSRMRALRIGKGLRAIGENAVYSPAGSFYACTGLEEIRVHPENRHFRSDGNCLIRLERETWLGTVLLRDTLILGCKNTDLTQTKDLFAIENFAFFGCKGLKKITVPKTVYRIGYAAFRDCAGLKAALLFPDTDHEPMICSYAFRGCASLEYVYIEKGLSRIEQDSFADCPALSALCFGGTRKDWDCVRTGYNHIPHFSIPVLCEQKPKD